MMYFKTLYNKFGEFALSKMKLIYTADLHGNEKFYRRLLGKAEEEKAGAVIIGGDLCPRIGETTEQKIHNQRLFFEDFLFPLFKDFKKRNEKCEIYIILGNDDFRINLASLENAERNKLIKSIHMKSAELDKNFNIAGYSFVNPTPFRLKDWEKPDFENDPVPAQLFEEEIRSAEKEIGAIKDDLESLKKLSGPKNTVYVIHAPPFNTKLDIITTGTHVGSKSVREFIEKEQPLLTLHGHIHESPQMSGSWSDKIGNTICINIGSSYPEDKLNCIVFDTNDLNNIEYFELTE